MSPTLIVLASLVAPSLDLPKLYELIEKHEGKRAKVYNDSEGIPTIGIGFNLKRADARKKIEALGLKYDDVLDGSASLSEKQIQTLFKTDVEAAIKSARAALADFDSLPERKQRVVVDMVFNLGEQRFKGFKKFIAAVNKGDYETAAKEMEDSRWYKQVKTRGKTLAEMMRAKE